jgi:hypothetical protein
VADDGAGGRTGTADDTDAYAADVPAGFTLYTRNV